MIAGMLFYCMGKIRIVLAEDHAMVRSSIRALLEHYPDFEVVGEAGDGQQALEAVKGLQPDILICDIRMPVLDGVALVRQMKEYSTKTRALVLSAYCDEVYVLELLKAGVCGYLLKTTDSKRLAEAIRLVHLGETVIDPLIAAKLANILLETKDLPSRREHLSFRELEILGLAATGMTNRAIASELGLSVRTVEGHFARILTKLHFPSRAKAVEYFRRHGRPSASGSTGEDEGR